MASDSKAVAADTEGLSGAVAPKAGQDRQLDNRCATGNEAYIEEVRRLMRCDPDTIIIGMPRD